MKIQITKKQKIIYGSWLSFILLLVIIIFIRSCNANYDFNEQLLNSVDNLVEAVKPALTEEELIQLRVKEEKQEEKYMSTQQKSYPNEINPEETAVRLQVGEERGIGVTVNNKKDALVTVTSMSKEIKILENSKIDIKAENFDSQFNRFKFKVSDTATPNTKAKIKLESKGLPTEYITISIEPQAKDTKDIEMYYDMVPGMELSSDFLVSIMTKQEEQYLKHTAYIKNYAKDVLVKKNGTILARNIGDSVVTYIYKNKPYKIYVRVRNEEIYTKPNKKETSIHFINPITEDLEVGDEYSLIAVTLPYSVSKYNANYYDKMALYESSDPDVCTVAYGCVKAWKPGVCKITAYNADKSLSTSINVKVVKKKVRKYDKVLKITPEKAAEYGLSNTNGRGTTDGLKKIVVDAKKQGKNKVYFTKALDLVLEPYGDKWDLIRLNSETMYDFNGTKIKIADHEVKQNEWGYHIFVMDGCKYTVVKNVNMTGTKPKGGCSISFPDAVECTIEGCNLGYNYWNIATYSGYYDDGKMKDIKANVFEFGNIRSDGTLGDSKCRVRSDYIDITHIDANEDFMIGDYTEFAGYSNAPSILYDIAYYDSNKKFIKKESCHAQYFAYYKPKDAAFCRVVFHTEELPKDGTEGYYTGYCVKIGHVKRGYKCLIKNNVMHNATHVNLVFCGEQRCIVDGNYFYQDGDIGCDIDWEDFFQAKSCDIVRNNVFTTRYDSFACVSGIGYVFRNNAFYHQAFININGGVRLFRMFGNVLRNIPSMMENGYDSIFNNNVMGNTFYFKRHSTDESTNGIIPRLRSENNTCYTY